ncbi:hypothetical protein F2Q70_00017158 [Brassica cretica]|uniref:Uncharacterized protein n=1 Tax=Brassica cretica TaxID=69181 RepID=A0A8S9I2X1_BRACR|nr:hypothetical protein F2Q70_00017158 [Brassica cretica]KAF2599987.1 hypothetical protein F2Q68_00010108 [Brassica cretica]
MVIRFSLNTQAGCKDVVDPLVGGVVAKAKLGSTIEVAFLVWQEVVCSIRMDSGKRSDLFRQHTWRFSSRMIFIKMFQ